MSHGRWFGCVIALLLIASMAQYAPVVFDALAHGEVQIWNLDASSLDGAGPTKYFKDIFVLGLSVYWPFAIGSRKFPRGTRRLLSWYVLWLMLFVSVGLVALIAQWSPLFFLVAGLRWLVLLHASVGLFLLSRQMPVERKVQGALLLFLILIGGLDAHIAIKQLSIGSATKGIEFAQGRLTGLFSNAAIAGMFGVALAVFALILDKGRTSLRATLILIAMFIAISSGTRFAMLSIGIVAAVMVWELCVPRLGRFDKQFIVVLAVPLAAALTVVGYVSMINSVGRGDMLETQFESGGRFANIAKALSDFSEAEPGELMFGRGLGVATNTAIAYLDVRGIDPSQYRFNTLIDNTFMTVTFQTGVLGLLIFTAGTFSFFRFVQPRRPGIMRRRYIAILIITVMACFGGNILEQYFLITTLLIAFGDTYWRSLQNQSYTSYIQASVATEQLNRSPIGLLQIDQH